MGIAPLVVREIPDEPYGRPSDSSKVAGGVPAGAAEDPLEADVVDDLGDEIAVLAAQIHAATHRLLVLIARFDALRGWERSGHRDCAHWLSVRTGIDLGAAREKVRAARALTALPLTSAAMSLGKLSFSKVRALTRVATAANEAALLPLALGTTTAHLERVVRAWKRGSRQDEAARERELFESRTLSVFPDDDGGYLVRGRLTPELAAVLLRALEAASDALFRGDATSAYQAQGTVPEPAPVPDTARAAGQRRADAIGLLAERALAAGLGSHDGAGLPISGSRAERYQVVLHVDAGTLREEGEPGASHLEDGTRVSAETSRRLSCDAAVVEVAHGSDGSVLDVGRRTRTVSPGLRRALNARDRGCRFPQCGLRFTDGHHVRHWADGGSTSLGNCLLLCRHHHRLVHEGGWRVRWCAEGEVEFIDPRGGVHYGAGVRAPALSGDPIEALVRGNAMTSVAAPDAWSASARWESERAIPDDILYPALDTF